MYSYYTRKQKQVLTLKISTILLGLSIADLQCRVGGVRTAPGDPIIYSFMYFMIGLEATPPKEKLARQSSGLRIGRLNLLLYDPGQIYHCHCCPDMD